MAGEDSDPRGNRGKMNSRATETVVPRKVALGKAALVASLVAALGWCHCWTLVAHEKKIIIC